MILKQDHRNSLLSLNTIQQQTFFKNHDDLLNLS